MANFSLSDISQLAKLIGSNREVESEDDDDVTTETPADFVSRFISPEKSVIQKEMRRGDFSSSNEEQNQRVIDEEKSRKRPEYEMVYQQSVTADDAYLSLGDKDPGSHSCESVIIRVKLPDIRSISDINLKISAQSMMCETEKYFLRLQFPRDVHPEKAKAKWDIDKHVLQIQAEFES